MSKILVLDDEPAVLSAFESLLSEQGHEALTAREFSEAMEILAAQSPEVGVLDICLPGVDGLEAFRQIRAAYAKLPIIIMTGQGSMATAIEATKLGAFEYFLKPFDPQQMLDAISKALNSARLMVRAVEVNPSHTQPSADALVGKSAAMQQVYKAIGRVAETEASVLICGDSGTGKELVARAIYQHSLRAHMPLTIVNCAAIPNELLESELFGHEKGAFTGAANRRIGKFEQANGGTLFLDEIGEVPLAVQSKLLRVLQERSFSRVGSNDIQKSDVRILAATNRDLEVAISAGTFREDLFHRLKVVTISLPPLHARADDIPLLVDYFLDRFAAQLRCERPILAPAALELLVQHAWPGNVRELEHCIHRVLIFTRGYPIQDADVRGAIDSNSGQRGISQPSSSLNASLQSLVDSYLNMPATDHVHEFLLELVDRLLVSEALRRCDGNQTQAAKLLGLARPTLHAKIRRYGLGLEDDA